LVAVGDPLFDRHCRGLMRVLGLLGEGADGVLERGGSEDLRDPVVDLLKDLGFPQVDNLGMVDAVGEGLLSREAAAVVGMVILPVALHPACAVAAEQHTPVGIWPTRWMRPASR
jgi:hypothetical protein